MKFHQKFVVILVSIQIGKKLSELIRDSGGQSAGGEQNRWQAELAQVTFELIGVSTNLLT